MGESIGLVLHTGTFDLICFDLDNQTRMLVFRDDKTNDGQEGTARNKGGRIQHGHSMSTAYRSNHQNATLYHHTLGRYMYSVARILRYLHKCLTLVHNNASKESHLPTQDNSKPRPVSRMQ